MIFTLLSGMLHGAILLVIEFAAFLEDDDVYVVSSKGFHQNFPLPQFFPNCSEALQVSYVEVHCFSRLSLDGPERRLFLPLWNML